jgi:tripartite ATP-independent transporter DctP family solute receptor
MNRRILLAVALIGTFVATTMAHAQQQVRLRFAGGFADIPGDGLAMGMKAFKQYVEFKSGGQMQVQLFFNTLGGSLQLTEQVKNGTLDMAAVDDSVLGSFHKPMQIFQIPYLFPSSPVAWEFMDGPFMREMTEDMRKATGIRTLTLSENGFRNLTNNVREIRTPEDLKGLKMRTMQSQVYVSFMRSMGASATPISWPELVPALKQNVVDGQENASSTIWAGKLHEVQKFMTVNEHVYGMHLYLMSDAAFQKLTPDQRQIILDGAKVHTAVANAAKAIESVEAVGKIRDTGVKVHVSTPSEKEAFRKSTQGPVIEFIASQTSKDLVDRLLAAIEVSKKKVYQN